MENKEDQELPPFEKTCKMIGEKYGPQMRELLDKIRARKEAEKQQKTDEDHK